MFFQDRSFSLQPPGAQTTVGLPAEPENIIVCVLDMTSNLNNQNGPDMAKEADPTGKRTLGVVTKPDRAMASDVTALDHLATGQFRMGLGFVVV